MVGIDRLQSGVTLLAVTETGNAGLRSILGCASFSTLPSTNRCALK